MALYCADVPFSIYSLTHTVQQPQFQQSLPEGHKQFTILTEEGTDLKKQGEVLMNTEQSNMEERRLSLLFVHLLCTKFYLKFMADVNLQTNEELLSVLHVTSAVRYGFL